LTLTLTLTLTATATWTWTRGGLVRLSAQLFPRLAE